MPDSEPRSLRFEVKVETAALPGEVIDVAGKDFSARRATVWPNVRTSHLVIHDEGDDWAEVTEGGTGPARFIWERSRYEWSQPGTVTSVVMDSNALLPGTTFELRAAQREGGSEVVMILDRKFSPSGWGRVGYALNRLVGERGFRFMLRQAMKGVEKQTR